MHQWSDFSKHELAEDYHYLGRCNGRMDDGWNSMHTPHRYMASNALAITELSKPAKSRGHVLFHPSPLLVQFSELGHTVIQLL